MVEPRGRRLNPLQTSAGDDAIPINRHLGMTAEEIGVEQFAGDMFLAGVDNRGVWGDRLDLSNVPRLDGVAKDDTHGVAVSRWSLVVGQQVSSEPGCIFLSRGKR